MDPAVEGCGRNPVRLTPVEVCQPALAARLNQPKLFLRTCAFPAHFRSLHILLFFTASRFACFCYFTFRIPLCLYVLIWRAYAYLARLRFLHHVFSFCEIYCTLSFAKNRNDVKAPPAAPGQQAAPFCPLPFIQHPSLPDWSVRKFPIPGNPFPVAEIHFLLR